MKDLNDVEIMEDGEIIDDDENDDLEKCINEKEIELKKLLRRVDDLKRTINIIEENMDESKLKNETLQYFLSSQTVTAFTSYFFKFQQFSKLMHVLSNRCNVHNLKKKKKKKEQKKNKERLRRLLSNKQDGEKELLLLRERFHKLMDIHHKKTIEELEKKKLENFESFPKRKKYEDDNDEEMKKETDDDVDVETEKNNMRETNEELLKNLKIDEILPKRFGVNTNRSMINELDESKEMLILFNLFLQMFDKEALDAIQMYQYQKESLEKYFYYLKVFERNRLKQNIPYLIPFDLMKQEKVKKKNSQKRIFQIKNFFRNSIKQIFLDDLDELLQLENGELKDIRYKYEVILTKKNLDNLESFKNVLLFQFDQYAKELKGRQMILHELFLLFKLMLNTNRNFFMSCAEQYGKLVFQRNQKDIIQEAIDTVKLDEKMTEEEKSVEENETEIVEENDEMEKEEDNHQNSKKNLNKKKKRNVLLEKPFNILDLKEDMIKEFMPFIFIRINEDNRSGELIHPMHEFVDMQNLIIEQSKQTSIWYQLDDDGRYDLIENQLDKYQKIYDALIAIDHHLPGTIDELIENRLNQIIRTSVDSDDKDPNMLLEDNLESNQNDEIGEEGEVEQEILVRDLHPSHEGTNLPIGLPPVKQFHKENIQHLRKSEVPPNFYENVPFYPSKFLYSNPQFIPYPFQQQMRHQQFMRQQQFIRHQHQSQPSPHHYHPHHRHPYMNMENFSNIHEFRQSYEQRQKVLTAAALEAKLRYEKKAAERQKKFDDHMTITFADETQRIFNKPKQIPSSTNIVENNRSNNKNTSFFMFGHMGKVGEETSKNNERLTIVKDETILELTKKFSTVKYPDKPLKQKLLDSKIETSYNRLCRQNFSQKVLFRNWNVGQIRISYKECNRLKNQHQPRQRNRNNLNLLGNDGRDEKLSRREFFSYSYDFRNPSNNGSMLLTFIRLMPLAVVLSEPHLPENNKERQTTSVMLSTSSLSSTNPNDFHEKQIRRVHRDHHHHRNHRDHNHISRDHHHRDHVAKKRRR
ncbi:hypothetical protein SNEBB_003669 [Seison nebaliae]|nr:hypothetical protein SNEBB_003669 [Seison nebaliae]